MNILFFQFRNRILINLILFFLSAIVADNLQLSNNLFFKMKLITKFNKFNLEMD